MVNNIIQFKNITKKFGEFIAVDNVSLNIPQGSIYGIIGESGAGKSTLVRIINGLEKPSNGDVITDGQNVNKLSQKKLLKLRCEIGMVFQQFNLFSQKTVLKNVEYPLHIANVKKKLILDKALKMLEFVGIYSQKDKYPNKLSGGQKQRAAIARALANNPKIILADEATSALDPNTTTQILKLLKKINKEFGITIVIITHEMDVISSICDYVSVMKSGKIVETNNTYDLFVDPQKNTTKKFIELAVRDIPSKETLIHLRKTHKGRLLSVPVVDKKNDISFAKFLAKYKLEGHMVFGSIIEVVNRPYGSMTFEVLGENKQINKMVNEILKYNPVLDFGYNTKMVIRRQNEFIN